MGEVRHVLKSIPLHPSFILPFPLLSKSIHVPVYYFRAVSLLLLLCIILPFPEKKFLYKYFYLVLEFNLPTVDD